MEIAGGHGGTAHFARTDPYHARQTASPAQQHFVGEPLPLLPFLYADLSISLNCNSKVTELKHTNWGAPLKGRRVWIRLNVLYVHLNP